MYFLLVLLLATYSSHSFTEAQYLFLLDCGRQAVWIYQLLGELGYKLDSIPICGDNQEFIFMASNAVMEQCSKPIDIQWHVIYDWIKDGQRLIGLVYH